MAPTERPAPMQVPYTAAAFAANDPRNRFLRALDALRRACEMKNTTWAGVALRAAAVAATIGLVSCAQPTPEQKVVQDAATALGGRDAILKAKTITLEGEGTNGNLGQDMTPEATGQTFQVTGYKRIVDLGAERMRIEQTRTPNFTYFQGPAAQKQIQGVDGDVGYNVAPNGSATRTPDPVTKDRRGDIYHHPLTLVRAALDPAAKLTNPRTTNGERAVDVTTAKGTLFTLAISDATGLPTRVVQMRDNTNLGDVAVETAFSDYKDVNGLKLPGRLVTKTDKYPTADLKIAKQGLDGEAGDLAAPAAAASAPAIAGVPPAKVEVTELGKGLWFLAGQSHHSVLVEFADHLTLIETPQHDTRALAVIAKAKEIRPDKPLTQVINTHHHFDHSGGLRAAVAEGLSILTFTGNAAYYQEAVSRQHTLVPDALAKSPKPLKLETIEKDTELKDAAMTVNLFTVDGNVHADTMLMAYFPKDRLLVEADVYSPAAAVHPFAGNLLENIKKRNLKVDRIVPIHGGVVPFADLVKVATPPTN
jgi:glyoxylase-like metal-dependent hydrolase (beta-lactamase superfamily II)